VFGPRPQAKREYQGTEAASSFMYPSGLSVVGAEFAAAEAQDADKAAGLGVGAPKKVGATRYCSPRHRMRFNSRNEGSSYVG
jgi:hypothetical protein